jgi:hypothetical protein
MDAKIFTTEKIARVLDLPEWRVVRFAQVPGFGIRPEWGEATGPGSRRLYSLENVCQIALAWWLLQAGLRVAVIGRVLKQMHKQGGLSHLLNLRGNQVLSTYLGVIRGPKGKTASQDAVYIHNWEHLENAVTSEPFKSVLVIPIGLSFHQLRMSLEEQKGE